MPPSLAEQYKQVLARHLPAGAVEGIYGILDAHAVHLHITRERTSKLGDYRWPQRNHPHHEISINGDLNPYMFLSVLLHEMAHLDIWLQCGTKVSPHGHEWQMQYATLLLQYHDCFPKESWPSLYRYIRQIPLNRQAGKEFEQVLRRHDPDYNPADDLHLDDLPAGSLFVIARQPQYTFRSLEKRRTRWICERLDDHKKYLVAGSAKVKLKDTPH